MPTTIPARDLPTLAGRTLEPSSWLRITQRRINQFADATNDHQFIHVSRLRAALTPFRKPIAHGFLSLSLLTYLNRETALLPDNLRMVINYGSDRVRFIAPVKVGQRIRSHQKIVSVAEKRPGEWLVKNEVTVEIEGVEKPALVAEMLALFVTGAES
ncbi:MAG TPA: MaoC family dehydratase [Woeseiaceae bacterium]|nr:MaoC family dehydratase [Woeseiaceae bacterium]